MKAVFLLPALALALSLSLSPLSASGVLDPWKYLPPPADWPAILRSVESKDHVHGYVRTYVAPFKQLQAAIRDVEVSPDTIKTSVLAALDAVLQSCRSLIVTELDFERKSKEVYKRLLDDATAHFDSPGMNHLEPVFKVHSIRYFVFQRFDDMLVASRRHRDFQAALKHFKDQIKHARRTMRDWKPTRFKFLEPRNLDLDLVQEYSAEVISLKVDRHHMDAEDLTRLKYQLHSLGNDGNVVLCLSSYALVAAALAAILPSLV